MNLHKLLENVLLECELYLGLALLFPSAEVAADARGNLDGCLAKRKLEAAKFMWMAGLRQVGFETSEGPHFALRRFSHIPAQAPHPKLLTVGRRPGDRRPAAARRLPRRLPAQGEAERAPTARRPQLLFWRRRPPAAPLHPCACVAGTRSSAGSLFSVRGGRRQLIEVDPAGLRQELEQISCLGKS